MSDNLYYTPPDDSVFIELREEAIVLWHDVDPDEDRYGYVTEKVHQIKDLLNHGSNFMFMVAMFDHNNQARLARRLSERTRDAVATRIQAGGQPDSLNPFLVNNKP